jgi:sporulation protein YlmC with PRC-barrel domain
MEVSFNKLRQKYVISVIDGKNLGKVCDIIFCYPEDFIKGFFVTGGKGFKLTRQDVFIPSENIIKIGEDVVLTNFDGDDKHCGKPPKKGKNCQPCQDHPCFQPPKDNPPHNPPQNMCGLNSPNNPSSRNFDECE